ncbi:pimeloyl-ACP methyl ester carboxylesterase [Kineococcus radiotolerans]|uniref:Pimeloyl-ACP methyl ester carboxylesterase n=1 Tax=Kineococcus radiotolerans TaxID=131568 RepID=A0A7W4TN26_KINRA|nr:alpha/beta hydrolase [Kineococcus radiotolerans]MBB2901527.1 pimeloyl-ACP methyl ester carboxylesterase [Kineococcus radiotolerans]
MSGLLEGFAVHRAGSAAAHAPAVVLVHGLGGAASTWSLLVPHLAADHRLHVLDLPGHGTAPPVAEASAMSPAALGERLHRLAAALAAEEGRRVHLVGHSLGGWVCLEAAAAPGADEAVASITAFTPAGLWTSPRRRPPLLPTGQQFARLAGRLPVGLVTTAVGRTLALGATSTAPRRLPAEVVRGAVEAVAAAAGYAAADAGIGAASFTRAGDVRVPVTVVAGGRDRVLPPSFLVRSCAPPQTRWLEWERSGHVPVWDHPADCARVVREQVRSARAGDGPAA